MYSGDLSPIIREGADCWVSVLYWVAGRRDVIRVE